jgi:hypothetical protein
MKGKDHFELQTLKNRSPHFVVRNYERGGKYAGEVSVGGHGKGRSK